MAKAKPKTATKPSKPSKPSKPDPKAGKKKNTSSFVAAYAKNKEVLKEAAQEERMAFSDNSEIIQTLQLRNGSRMTIPVKIQSCSAKTHEQGKKKGLPFVNWVFKPLGIGKGLTLSNFQPGYNRKTFKIDAKATSWILFDLAACGYEDISSEAEIEDACNGINGDQPIAMLSIRCSKIRNGKSAGQLAVNYSISRLIEEDELEAILEGEDEDLDDEDEDQDDEEESEDEDEESEDEEDSDDEESDDDDEEEEEESEEEEEEEEEEEDSEDDEEEEDSDEEDEDEEEEEEEEEEEPAPKKGKVNAKGKAAKDKPPAGKNNAKPKKEKPEAKETAAKGKQELKVGSKVKFRFIDEDEGVNEVISATIEKMKGNKLTVTDKKFHYDITTDDLV